VVGWTTSSLRCLLYVSIFLQRGQAFLFQLEDESQIASASAVLVAAGESFLELSCPLWPDTFDDASHRDTGLLLRKWSLFGGQRRVLLWRCTMLQLLELLLFLGLLGRHTHLRGVGLTHLGLP